MTWGPMWFVLFVTVFFSICIPSAIGAYWCWTNRKIEGKTNEVLVRWAILLAAVSYDCFSKLVANAFGYIGPRPKYTLGFAIVFWQGQIVLSAAMIYLVMFFVGNKKD